MSKTLGNDTRQEANTALMEIEKGFRSPRVGDQCEAIVKFPSLVDRFPFPILINAAYLKLAELYRTSVNFLRLNILEVLQVSQKHLKKITSVDEFLRRIFSVVHSNDPIARAVTMRVFGAIAIIVAERKNVHHCIHHGLESNEEIEASAAVFATQCLCEHSAVFAAGVYEKIATMIQGMTTPVEKKLSLIPILELMHHDISTATQVRELCVGLLPSHSSLSLVSSLLSCLTTLTLHTLVHLTDQVKLLLYYAQGDGRKLIREAALTQLNRLASQLPHMWSQDMIQGLFLVIDRGSRDNEKASALKALHTLSKSSSVHNMAFLKGKVMAFTYSPSPWIAVCAVGVVSNITMAAHKTLPQSASGELVDVVKMVSEVCLLTDFEKIEEKSLIKVILGCLVDLSGVSSEVNLMALDTLLSLLPLLSVSQASLVCQALVSIASQSQGIWSCVSSKLLEYLSQSEHKSEVLLSVSSVIVQLFACEGGPVAEEKLSTTILPVLLSQLWETESSSLWLAYKMARRASTMGIHLMGKSIYSKLSKVVTSSKYRNWLTGLQHVSEAQLLVVSSCRGGAACHQLIPTLSQSQAAMHHAMMLIEAASPPTSFPLRFLSSHAQWLICHSQLLASCVSLSLVPPPSTNLSHGTEKKFRLCVSQFQQLSQQYDELYKTLFDADPSTLQYIKLLQQSCLLMASIISSIACSRKPFISPGKPSTPSSTAVPPLTPVEITDNFETKCLLGQVCRNVYQKAQAAAESLQLLPVGEEHTNILIECCQSILSVPLCLPPYFFASLQQTTVKLALSPALPAVGDQLTLTLDNHLVLKVEGVIQHTGKAKMYRSLHSVYVKATPVLDKLLSHDVKVPKLKSLEQTEPVEKDYFQAQFVLSFPVCGYYSVLIEASLLDQEGTLWYTGHKEQLRILVNTEENLKQRTIARDSVSSQRPSSSSVKQRP